MPDFICIGAPRSGTTWLFERLSEHPDFWLPPVKEVHYFDRDTRYVSPNTLAETKLVSRLRRPTWLLNALARCTYALFRRGPSALKWQVRWFFSDFTDDWYLSLFDGVNAITGEITPSYSILAPKDVERIHSLLPRVRIVYLLRNPIERSWSNYRYQCGKRGDRSDIDGLLEHLSSTAIVSRSAYLRTIDLYAHYFGRENVLISSYDALKLQPLRMLSQIVSFLGGRPELVETFCNLRSVENAAPVSEMPKFVKDAMLERYIDSIERLAARYGSPFDSWARMEMPHWSEGASLVFHP